MKVTLEETKDQAAATAAEDRTTDCVRKCSTIHQEPVDPLWYLNSTLLYHFLPFEERDTSSDYLNYWLRVQGCPANDLLSPWWMGSKSPLSPFCHHLPSYFEDLCKSSQILLDDSSTSLVRVKEFSSMCGAQFTVVFATSNTLGGMQDAP